MTIPRRKAYFPPNIIFKMISFLSKGVGTDEVRELESELTLKLGIPNPIVVSSGRIGLYLILKASNLPKGSEIIMPGFTFGLLKSFIQKAGFKPITVDIDIETFQMPANKLEGVITKNTGAILATHLFGAPCDILNIQKVTKKHNILLIEDCAESLGARSHGKLTGTFGDVAISSFNIAKPLQGITGGLIFGKNKKMINKIKKEVAHIPKGINATKKDVIRGLLGHFISQTFIWPMLMYIFSFDFFRNLLVSSYRLQDNTKIVSASLPPYLAHITRLNLKEYIKRLIRREQIRSLYRKYLDKYIDFQKPYSKTFSSNYMIVAKINNDPLKLRRYLALRGIDIAIKDEVVDDCLKVKGSNISKVFNNLIALPIFEGLGEQKIKYIAGAMINFLSANS
jgi:dTDP-4-amino-4,6-dideoxygalactose transaminase